MTWKNEEKESGTTLRFQDLRLFPERFVALSYASVGIYQPTEVVRYKHTLMLF